MENKPVQPLTAAEQRQIQSILMELLAGQIVRFTAGERSSVPAETARELMDSLCMTLQVQNPAHARQLLHGNAGAALAAGQKHLKYRWALCRQLWRRAAKTAPVWQNLALRETLESIGRAVAAKAAYDVQFFAHELPCSIDYPLCNPMPETLHGAEYNKKRKERETTMPAMFITILTGYLIIINAAALLLMAVDKRRAKRRKWRVPEAALFGAALLGGSAGAWAGMYLFHHKTRHWYFVVGMPLILAAQLAAGVWLAGRSGLF